MLGNEDLTKKVRFSRVKAHLLVIVNALRGRNKRLSSDSFIPQI